MRWRLQLPEAILVFLMLGVGCSQPAVVVPPPVVLPPPPPAPVPITTAELDTLGEILRLEDRREFDAARFDAWANSPSVLVRRHAAIGAGRIGDRTAGRIIMRLMVDSDSAVRADASFALGELGDTSTAVVQALITATRATSGSDAIEAIGGIGRLAVPSGFAAIVALLADSSLSSALHQEALLALSRFPRTASTFDAASRYTSAGSAETRWRAYYALTRSGTDLRAIPLLMQATRDPEPLVRANAARGFRVSAVDSVVRRLEVVATLTGLLRDSHPHVRINAVRALAAFREPASAPAIIALLRDPDPNVVLATVESLVGFGHAANELRSIVQDPGRSLALRNTALNGLLQSDTAFVTTIAREWTLANGWLQRFYGVRLLAAVARSQPVQPDLRRMVNDGDPRVGAAALQAVAADTTNPPYALFIEKLADRDPAIRAAATRGLQRRRSASDLEPLLRAYERAQQDTQRTALQAAITALGALANQNVPVARSFFLRFRRPEDPRVHQMVVSQLGPGTWGPVRPADSGRPPEYYRNIARRYLNPDSNCVRPRVRIQTAGGSIVLELTPDQAPLTVVSFLTLAERGYFNNSRWHRVVPNFVLQDGEPRGDGSGTPGYTIRDEINRLRYERGSLGMALSGPNTGGSQFFITHSPQPHLDGGYTIFGRVVEGMNIADSVTLDDPIISIEVIR